MVPPKSHKPKFTPNPLVASGMDGEGDISATPKPEIWTSGFVRQIGALELRLVNFNDLPTLSVGKS
jgi:hypothetical protein